MIIYNSKNNKVIRGDLSMNWLYPSEVYCRTDHPDSSNIDCWFTWDEWHCKYRHVGITGLKWIFTRKLVYGFDVNEDSSMGDCDVYIQAKQSHALFPKKAEFWLKQPGKLTHTDVWGPVRTILLSRMQYNVTFMDDCMRHCICEQMKSKDRTSSKLKQYLVIIEWQHGYTPKQIRIDQGGEYLTNEFCTWCADHGIIIEVTVLYSPSQNGIVLPWLS